MADRRYPHLSEPEEESFLERAGRVARTGVEKIGRGARAAAQDLVSQHGDVVGAVEGNVPLLAMLRALRTPEARSQPEATQGPWYGSSSDPGVAAIGAAIGAGIPGGKKVPKKVAVGSVFDPVTDAAQARAMALRGEHLKRDPAGKYVGAPEWVDSPGALRKMRTDALGSVEQGAFNADWYERQRNLARDIADDPTRQSLFARGTAAYSPQAMPKVELPAFLRQHNEAMLTGKTAVPRTGAQSRNVAQAYEVPGELHPERIRLGRKTGPYAQAKDPTVDEGTLYKTANDIWHGRVMGYGEDFSRGFTPQEHGFLTGENLVLAERAREAGLPVTSPRSAQAATWGATRMQQYGAEDAARLAKQTKLRERYERDPEKWRKANPDKSPPPKAKPVRSEEQLRAAASAGLDTAAPRQTAFLTQEAVPGRTPGHLEGLIDAPEDVRRQYTADIVKATGRDPTIEGLGLYARQPIGGLEGQYKNLTGEVERNPLWTDPVLVSNVARKGEGVRTPETEQTALDLAAKVGGYMRGQEFGAWNRFIPEDMSRRVSSMNAARLRGAAPEELQRLRDAGLDVANVEPGVHHVTRFGDAGPIAGSQTEVANLVPGAERGTMEAGYQSGITGKVGTGEATRALIKTLRASGVDPKRASGRWNEVAPLYNAIDRELAGTHDFKLREDLLRARDIIAQGGLSGLMAHVRKHGAKGLPAVLLGALGLRDEQPAAAE